MAKLNADELGEKGERRFAELCADAKLTCNQSTRDRTGWDFIVEFPFDSTTSETTLDKRGAPISCHFQVKTMWQGSDHFRMRLSAAERLAKDAKPTFIYVFKVDTTLTFTESFIIPVIDDVLSMILKRLRNEQAKGSKAINNKYITFRPGRVGSRFEPTGLELKQAVVDCCGTLDTFMLKKAEQLKRSGYAARPYESKMTFLAGSHSELVDAFLGLRTIEVKDMEHFETRFEIKLPFDQIKGTRGTIKIEPQASDECTVSIRDSNGQLASRFHGLVFFPPIPNLPKHMHRALIKSTFFLFTFSGGEWLTLFKTLRCFAEGGGSISIKPKMATISELTIPIQTIYGLNALGYYDYMIGTFSSLQYLYRRAGAKEVTFSFHEVTETSKQIRSVHALFETPSTLSPFTFTTDRPKDDNQLGETLSALYTNWLQIGDAFLMYEAKVEFRRTIRSDKVVWESISLEAGDIETPDNFPDDYNRFVDAAKQRRRLSAVVTIVPTAKEPTSA